MNKQGGNPFNQGRGGFDFNFGFGQPRGDPFENIFRHFQHGGDFGRQQQRVNRDLKVVVDLDLADTLAPQTKHISVKHLNSHRETVTVEIPRGVSSNMQMKYSGHGDRSYPDLPPGDLYISFRILRHPDFDIEGLDLIHAIKLNCIDAITGSTLSIKGLDGTEFSWNVPVGTQNGSRFRIGQQGLWSIDHPVRGSLILHINLVVPSNLTAEQLITLEQISKELKENTGTL
jgi:DnaJ-class molecular chaperone